MKPKPQVLEREPKASFVLPLVGWMFKVEGFRASTFKGLRVWGLGVLRV